MEINYDKVRKSKRIRKLMCGRESLLVPYYLLGSFDSLIPSFFIYHYVCMILKNLVCVKWKKYCICMRKKYKQLVMVEGQLVINIFFNVFFLDFLDVMKIIFFQLI
jgi:hypothetical protein